ncbi:MAG: hypothetical protein EPO57_00615 [Chitinophagaceae bacterium]|nr:MAG: hypothetical protein EPO57_00615 [Chitinophagaceae bacterium]
MLSMKNFILSMLSIVVAFSAQAQTVGTIKGKLVDTVAKQKIANATVSVLLAKDSSLVSFGLSDDKGVFEIANLGFEDYTLLVSVTGYENLRKSFSITEKNKLVDCGEISIQKNFKTLEEVTITDAAPVRVKDDTIQFKMDAFKTKPNATVEDALKKLPGVQVQKDGSITAMGENVQKIYVDGKEFFGNDPKLATKNITAEMVDQIQVFDDMSDQAKFTKIDDGSRAKTINIKLKKDKNKGDFGKITAGAGTDNRFEGNLSFNHFRGDQRISVLAAANNTNKQGFSFSDIISSQGGMAQFSRGGGGGGMMTVTMGGGGGNFGGGGFGGGGGGFGGSNSGVTTAKSAGFNYNDKWSPKIDFRSSYFYSESNNVLSQGSFRQNYFPKDSSSNSTTESESENNNKNHRFNIRSEYAIDSMNSILYTANLNIQESYGTYSDTSFTFSDATNKFLAIAGKTFNQTERNGLNYSGELMYRKKFKKVGRTVTVGWRNSTSNSDAETKNISPNSFYKPDGSLLFSRSQNQMGDQATNANNNTISTSYTEPVGHNKIIELNYAFSDNRNTSDKKTHDFNSGTGKYDAANLMQTNYFKNSNTSSRIGMNYRLQEKKYNYQLGMGVQFSELSSKSFRAATGKDTTITQRFTNFYPSANFNYSVNRTKNFRANYRGRTNAPSVSQLQDVLDVSNPLQVKTGNPSLKQEFINSFSVNYNTFNIINSRFFAANINVNTTNNKIVNSLDTLNRSVTITKPVNLNGAYNTFGLITVGFPLKKVKGTNLNFSTISNYNRDISMINKQENITQRISLSQSFGFNYNKDKFDMGLSGNVGYNKATYSLQNNLNTSYFTQTYSADFSYTFKKGILLSTDVDYYINSGRSEGYNQAITMWNGSISKQVLKNKAGEFKLSVYDILNQNKSVNRNVGDNYYEDTRTNVVKQFFSFSFTYNLNKMAGNQGQMQMQQMLERGGKQIRIFQQH